MFHVKLSTALCNFLPFSPSFMARSWRFSWNSMAEGGQRQMRVSVIVCGGKSPRCVRRQSSCEATGVGATWLGAKPTVTVRKHISAKTRACAVNITQSPPAAEGSAAWKCSVSGCGGGFLSSTAHAKIASANRKVPESKLQVRAARKETSRVLFRGNQKSNLEIQDVNNLPVTLCYYLHTETIMVAWNVDRAVQNNTFCSRLFAVLALMQSPFFCHFYYYKQILLTVTYNQHPITTSSRLYSHYNT